MVPPAELGIVNHCSKHIYIYLLIFHTIHPKASSLDNVGKASRSYLVPQESLMYGHKLWLSGYIYMYIYMYRYIYIYTYIYTYTYIKMYIDIHIQIHVIDVTTPPPSFSLSLSHTYPTYIYIYLYIYPFLPPPPPSSLSLSLSLSIGNLRMNGGVWITDFFWTFRPK